MIKVLTFNIHKCIGGIDRRYDPDRTIEAIAHHKPDIVFLQEVAETLPGSKGERQSDLLGSRLKLDHRVYFGNVRLRKGVVYGNAILSRFPIYDIDNIDVTLPLKKVRRALHARLRVRQPRGKERTLHLFNMHLGLSGIERKWQLRKFLNSHPFAGLHARAPIILGGDLNDVWGTLGKKLLYPSGFKGWNKRIFTFPAYAPIRALDGIYVRGDLRILNLYRSRLGVAKSASDHLPLIAELELQG